MVRILGRKADVSRATKRKFSNDLNAHYWPVWRTIRDEPQIIAIFAFTRPDNNEHPATAVGLEAVSQLLDLTFRKAATESRAVNAAWKPLVKRPPEAHIPAQRQSLGLFGESPDVPNLAEHLRICSPGNTFLPGLAFRRR